MSGVDPHDWVTLKAWHSRAMHVIVEGVGAHRVPLARSFEIYVTQFRLLQTPETEHTITLNPFRFRFKQIIQRPYQTSVLSRRWLATTSVLRPSTIHSAVFCARNRQPRPVIQFQLDYDRLLVPPEASRWDRDLVAHVDFLVILDFCFAGSAFRGSLDSNRVVEIVAASDVSDRL